MRYRFSEVFQENSDGTLKPLRPIKVGSVVLGPAVTFGSGTSFGGIDFSQFRGRDIEGDQEGDILVVKGIY